MTGANFAALIREYTRTNSTTLTDATIVLLANSVKDDLAKEIAKADEDLFGVRAHRDLIASDAAGLITREYTLPDNTLKIKRVEAKLNGTDWLHLAEMDLNLYKRTTDEATILSLFANEEGKAFYDIYRRSLWIYSGTITATTAGLLLWAIEYPADIDASTLASTDDLIKDPTTTSTQLPRQFHELWARRVSILWKSNREKPIALNERELSFRADMDLALAAIRNANGDRALIAQLPNDAKFQY